VIHGFFPEWGLVGFHGFFWWLRVLMKPGAPGSVLSKEVAQYRVWGIGFLLNLSGLKE